MMSKDNDKRRVDALREMEEGTVLLRAVRVEGGVQVECDEALTPALLAAVLGSWLDHAEVRAKYEDAFIALAAQLVERRMAAERIARWGRGFGNGKDDIS